MFVTLKDFAGGCGVSRARARGRRRIFRQGLSGVDAGTLNSWKFYAKEARDNATSNPSKAQKDLTYITAVFNGWDAQAQSDNQGELDWTTQLVTGDASARQAAAQLDTRGQAIDANQKPVDVQLGPSWLPNFLNPTVTGTQGGSQAMQQFSESYDKDAAKRDALDCPTYLPQQICDLQNKLGIAGKWVVGLAAAGAVIYIFGPAIRNLGGRATKKNRRRRRN